LKARHVSGKQRRTDPAPARRASARSKRVTAAAKKTPARSRPRKAAAEPTPAPQAHLAAIGLRIKHARRVRAFTLKVLAERAGCSESMLSKVERGLATPSLTALHKLAQVLGTNVSALTSPVPVGESPVMRVAERSRVAFASSARKTISLERLVLPGPGLLLQADVHVIGPRFSSEQEITHAGEELGYVLEGRVELRIDDEAHELGPGDSFHFRSERPHAYRNLGATEARIIWVNTPPTF
jgi:transcriptional regulator with XRE-family HTH domain